MRFTTVLTYRATMPYNLKDIKKSIARYMIINSLNSDEFILCYKAAIKAKLNRSEFAFLINVKPDTIRRRRSKIEHEIGLRLPLIEDGEFNGELDNLKLEKYKTSLEELQKNSKKTSLIDVNNREQKRYIITSAQNATPINHEFLTSLQVYAAKNNAELIIIPYRYRNPHSVWNSTTREDDYWDIHITPYLMNKHLKINDTIRVMGHINLSPTAVSPLSGFDSYVGEISGIFGHPSIELKCIPTPAHTHPKMLSTTGSITVPNYSNSKAGHKGEFNHTYAAIVLEIDGDKFYHRHIHASDNGEFYDLDKKYTPKGVEDSDYIEALITGDIHAAFHNETVEKATYIGSESIMGRLNPKVWALHDLEDFYTRNHHHRNNDLIRYGKHHYGRDNVEEGLQISADFVDKHSREGMTNVVIKSNHDEALDRWLRESEPKNDPENAVFYHYMKYHQYKNLRMSKNGYSTIDPFKFWCENPVYGRGLQNIDKTVFLKRDQSYTVKGIELGFHGDRGPNGSRGSIRSLSKIGPKIVIGHSHTPGIFQGAYQVGVSANLNLEYVSGPSSWMHTHCIIYPDGSRTLIHIVNGKWTLK